MRRKRFHRKYKRHVRRKRVSGRRIARIARNVIRNEAETKFYTKNIAAFTITSTLSWLTWADGLGQGVTAFTRVGNQVRAKTLSFRLGIGWDPQNDSPVSEAFIILCRVLVLYPRKGVDNLEMELSNAGLTLFTRPDPLTSIVMYDKTFILTWNRQNAAMASWGGHPFMRFLEFSKRFPYVFNYAGNGAHDVERQPAILFLSNLSAGAQNDMPCKVFGYTCMSFKDT